MINEDGMKTGNTGKNNKLKSKIYEKIRITILIVVLLASLVYLKFTLDVKAEAKADQKLVSNFVKTEFNVYEKQWIENDDYPTPWLMGDSSNIGVIICPEGEIAGVPSIMGLFHTAVGALEPNSFMFVGRGGQKFSDYNVLIIPTGGHYDLDSSYIMDVLGWWVEAGGTLVSMDFYTGENLNVLPRLENEELSGTGWSELGVYGFPNRRINFEKVHPVMSGQQLKKPPIMFDAVIEEYPEDAVILARKDFDKTVSMIEYKYGKGRVIVTSNYSDAAYKKGNYSWCDLIFVRDLIRYAEICNKRIYESKYFLSQKQKIKLPIINPVDEIAAAAVIFVTNPNNELQDSIYIDSLSLIPGDSAEIDYNIKCSKRGIYIAKYILIGGTSDVISRKYVSCGFVKYGLRIP